MTFPQVRAERIEYRLTSLGVRRRGERPPAGATADAGDASSSSEATKRPRL